MVLPLEDIRMNVDTRPPPYSMRLDPELRAQLEAAAKAAGRSLHAEISIRLEESLKGTTNKTTNNETILTLEEVRHIALEVVRKELDARLGKAG